ncbi:ATP-binding cassette domain-containing protein [Labrenzia sp. DG1229]|uniref:amino acid ABC transporter ATP-binding protein n=1 Tax=Labrenzia sp. DG1229 TaxID=681847 RepID=UPI000A8443F6
MEIQHLTEESSPSVRDLMIDIRHVNKWYGDFQVLKDINLTVHSGERIVVCGPSGSGKSTLIRCINRLEEHQQGDIIVDGIPLTGDVENIDQIRSEVGMCFQQFNLFPHLTVMENCVLAPMSVRRKTRREAESLARRYLEKVRIPDQADKLPANCQVDSSSGWLSPAHCAWNLASCCLTSRHLRWTRR